VDIGVVHPRFQIPFAPRSASWLNTVERFFCDLTTHRLRPGVFRDVADLVPDINNYVATHNVNQRPIT